MMHTIKAKLLSQRTQGQQAQVLVDEAMSSRQLSPLRAGIRASELSTGLVGPCELCALCLLIQSRGCRSCDMWSQGHIENSFADHRVHDALFSALMIPQRNWNTFDGDFTASERN